MASSTDRRVLIDATDDQDHRQEVREVRDGAERIPVARGTPGTGGGAGPPPPTHLSSVFSHFVRLSTLPATAVAIMANAIMIVLVFLLPILCQGRPSDTKPLELCRLEPFSILVYTHAAHWLIHLIVDQFLKKEHKKSRLRGYIAFYLQTKNIRRTPFYLVSIGNAVLLITVTALHDYCDPDQCPDKMMKVDYLRGLITLECLIIICLWFNYIINVREFHAQRPVPDVLSPDAMRHLLVDEASAGPSTDYDDSLFGGTTAAYGSPPERDEILEKQAELIRYLRSHIAAQNEKLLALSQQIPLGGSMSDELADA
ncbi:hypothetical protein TCAL_13327 [Tigriopus californicus]|uniref:Transmembrane protein 192 n=1 Tax=Tigriopus californicus TaxID=6832 RepID=A0A553NUX6_TIGCA|nr:transmembrane protein 192-like [Tigriopus californicus]TRY69233.1 hypothetical protein TCAL_13327 [Tigriopus californicus]|eukprot:TCALIF_13327-PA protein Name:"Similar to Tmem192 Transmembrane protein 192 (Mus musculus)" AED:0.04 eAED:0.04 QI:618/1/1/1/1/1/2/247/312